MSSTTLRGTVRQYGVAVRAMIVLTVIVGLAYPLAMTGIAQLTMNHQANGSMIVRDGTTVGSSLIGQSFTDSKGNPLTQWFQSRPSAAGNGYDADNSGGSNLGPDNPALTKLIDQRKAVIEKTYGVTASQIPADAVTASGSGLDPDISVQYADLQVRKVAETRGLSVGTVQALVTKYTAGRELGYLGQSTVNVLELNLALSKLDPAGDSR